jgi:branched-chain amino acid transport system permease protein
MMELYEAHVVLIQATMTGLLLALSIQVPMRMGVFSFAGVGAYGIGAYTAGILVLNFHGTVLPAIASAGLLAGVTCLLLGLLVYRLAGLYLAMATVAFDLIIGVVALNGGDLTGGATGLYGVLTNFTMGHLYVVVLAALVAVAFTERGRTGRRVSVVRDDPDLALALGINLRRYRLTAFAASGVLGGVAGATNILARTTISPVDIDFHLIVLALTMIIVGGARSWKGAVMGAVIFTWLPELLASVGRWQEVVYGVIVAAAAVLAPGGLYGLITDGAYRYRRRGDARSQPTVDQDSPAASGLPEAELFEELARDTAGGRS